MRILVVSDTHGREKNLQTVLSRVGKLDMVIHCGDVEGGEGRIRSMIDCELHMVRGNNDFFTSLEREEVFSVGNYRIFLTHGHLYHIGFGTEALQEAALVRGASIAIFGHTHRPLIDQTGSVTLINPGSISQPRQENHKPSFIIMEIDRFGVAHFALNYL